MENYVKLALKLGADDVIVERFFGISKQLRFANNTMTALQTWNSDRLKIFLVWKGRVVRTVLDINTKEMVTETIKNLLRTARSLKPSLDYYGIAEGPFKYKKIKDAYDSSIENINIADKVEAAMNAALGYSKKTAGVLYSNVYNRELFTSTNVEAKEKISSIELSLRAFNEKDESGHASMSSRTLDNFDPESVGEKAGLISQMAKNPKGGQKGMFDVVFDPLSAADIIAHVGRFASAFAVDSGFSFLKDKIGKKVGSNVVTLKDGGDVPNGLYSSIFDEEGVPTQTTTIIERGILKTYLHNTSTARKYRTKTTANAGLIAPASSNVILQKGKISSDELFKEVKNGLYITNVWYTRFQNYLKGDFSTIPRDGVFLIKNGEIAQSIKGIRISDNLENIMKNVVAISDKPEWIHWWEVTTPVLTPYVLVKKVNITLPTM